VGSGQGAGGEIRRLSASLIVASQFRDLTAYRLAIELADEIHEAVAGWPSFARWTVGLQLVRAADSIGANIAEASGRWHEADKRRLLIVARGSLYETEHWLLRAQARSLLAPEADEKLDELMRTISGLIKKPTRR
jgi:four helix bundle protein